MTISLACMPGGARVRGDRERLRRGSLARLRGCGHHAGIASCGTSAMHPVLSATAPFFAVIALGALAGRRGTLPQSAVRPINSFVFVFAMPALIGLALWRMDVEAALDPRVLLGWLIAGAGAYALSAGLMAAIFRDSRAGRSAIRAQGGAIGNIGFLGVPLALGVFGEGAAATIAMALMVDLVIVIPVTIAWLELSRSEAAAGRAMLRAMGRSVGNPFFLSILGGAGLSTLGVPIPAVVETTLTFLGAAASPTALFALGLYLSGNARIERPVEAGALSALKLLLHPALMWLALAQGFGVEGLPLQAAVLLAAMPVASNVFVIAEAYGAAPKLAADAVTLSTVASLATLSLLLLTF
jgi:predicted permease